MVHEPRYQGDYSDRQVEAAHRVLVDIGQVLASFKDSMVLVGGWVPDLLITKAKEPHIGSIDVDLALDATKLKESRYADLLKMLFDTRRYHKGDKPFQMRTEVDMKDGKPPISVDVEFLADRDVKLKSRNPKLIQGFRVLQADGCGTAFHDPTEVEIEGRTVQGAENKVRLRVATLPDFLIMKCYALAGRDKPKDAYDIVYSLLHVPGGMKVIAKDWNQRSGDKDVKHAIAVLKEKFEKVTSFGPRQAVDFHQSGNPEVADMQARTAFECVDKFIKLLH